MKLSIGQLNQSFASVLIAFSLFGFFWPHHTDSTGRHHQMNFIQQNADQDDWSKGWYAPPRSPGFHEDFGS
jgi:hypothetical protein